MTDNLNKKKCVPCEGGVSPLTEQEINDYSAQLVSAWKVDSLNKQISHRFSFTDFHQTMAFVNAVAWISHQQNHHPDLAVGYNYCTVAYTTHAIDGLSSNDFVCANLVEKLLET